MPAIPVLLDTDIGTSLDDTICLAYLAASPAFEVVGVSTVTDKSLRRGDYARSILHHYGVEAPVVPGAERSVSGETMQPKLLPDLPAAPAVSAWASGAFAELYAEALSRYGEELVVLSIGPFTNLSAAGLGASGVRASASRNSASRNPAPRPRLVSMASSLSGEAEWNVRLDPEAAADLLAARAATPEDTPTAFQERILLPIETTRRLTMKAKEAMDRLPRHLTTPFGDLSAHPRHPGKVVLHDPLAAHILLEPEHCTYRSGEMEITLGADPRTRGRSRFQEAGPSSPGKQVPGPIVPRREEIVVAVDVDREAALEAILSALA